MSTGPSEDKDEPGALNALLARVIDLTVYAPTGLAVSVVEEIPELIAKGRGVVGQRVNNARFAGKVAIDLGLSRVKKPLDERLRPSDKPGVRRTSESVADESVPHSQLPESPVPESLVPESLVPESRAPELDHKKQDRRPGARDDVDGSEAFNLAIPGYAALSASQVVARLGSLGADDLRAIHAYELATRGRRTIIGRVEQLLETISSDGDSR